jgi:hypothetical protein
MADQERDNFPTNSYPGGGAFDAGEQADAGGPAAAEGVGGQAAGMGQRVPGRASRSPLDVTGDDGAGTPSGPDPGAGAFDAAALLNPGLDPRQPRLWGADPLTLGDQLMSRADESAQAGSLEDRLVHLFAGAVEFTRPADRILLHDAVAGESRGVLLGALDRGGAEDTLNWELSLPGSGLSDWGDDIYDADGRETANAAWHYDAILVDTTRGTFGTPGLGHTGAARNGRFYDHGEECGPGGFGSMAGGKNRLAWRFPGEDPLGWSDAYGTATLTADGELTFTHLGTPAWGYQTARVTSDLKWVLLTGDFDIQADFAAYTVSGDEITAIMFVAANVGGAGGSNDFQIQRRGNVSGGRYEAAREQSGTWVSLGTFTTSDVSGKLRITRVAGTLSGYRWSGATWVQVGSNYTHASLQGDVYVHLGMDGSASRTGSVKFSSFAINSGLTSNRAGWYREGAVAGAERGLLADMPAELAVLTTATSIELMDAAAKKLWMGFNRGTNNLLHDGSSPYVHRVAWCNGVLLISYSVGCSWTVEGGAILIDFRLDRARIHRLAASTICGGFYCGSQHASGALVHRNAGKGYQGDYDDWAVKTYGSNSVALYDQEDSGGYLHWAVGGGLGLEIFRSKPGNFLAAAPNPESTYSVDEDGVEWCAFDPSGQVLWIETSTRRIRSAPKTAWEAGFDGFPFATQYMKEWPHYPASYVAQWRLALRPSPTRLYVATDDGIYVSEWPGAWAFEYGCPVYKPGSNHDILPPFLAVSAIAYARDGSDEFLVCNLDWGQAVNRVVVIHLNTHTVWAEGLLTEDARHTYALGVLS